MKKFIIFLLAYIWFNTNAVMAQDFKVLHEAFLKSYELESSGRYGEAIVLLDKLTQRPYELELRLGWLHYLKGNHSVSIQHYKKAIKLAPQSIEAQLGMIKPLTAMENYGEVLKVYEAILKINPGHAQSLYWLAVGLYYQKEYGQAAAHLLVLLNLYPFDYDGILLMAQTELARGKLAEAKMYYQRALLYYPQQTEIMELIQKL